MIDVQRAEAYFDYDDSAGEWPCPASFETARDGVDPDPACLAPLITVVGASGGVGRSTIALLAGLLSAASGIDTVLIEGDLQFGDLWYWLGLDDEQPSLGDPGVPIPIPVAEGLELYKAPVLPEAAEEVTDRVAAQLSLMRAERGLAIADTGGFWSGLTANLVVEADLVLLAMDGRPTSVVGALRASELCTRLGVPQARIVPVLNRWNPRGEVKPSDLSRAFDVPEVNCIPDGKRSVTRMVEAGDCQELAAMDNPMVRGVRDLLTAVLPRVGHLYKDARLGSRREAVR